VICNYKFCKGRFERRYFTTFSGLTGKPVWKSRLRAHVFNSIKESKETLFLCKSFYDDPETIRLCPLYVPVKIIVYPNGDKACVPVHFRLPQTRT